MQRQQEQQRQQQNQQRGDDRQRQQDRRDDRKEGRDERRDQRQDGRDQRQDTRQDRRDDRQDSRQDRRDDRQESRQDRRDDRRDDRARRIDDLRKERRESREGNRTVIREGDRTIIREGNRTFIRRDENDRFNRRGDARIERRGNEIRTVSRRNGVDIITVTDANGRLLRRSRYVNGREVVIIDNRPRGGRRADAFFVALPALALGALAIPRDRYIVEAESAPPEYIYGALMAPPVEPLPRAYTLDEIRYSPEIRNRMPRIDLDTITFDTGSWEVSPDQYDRLAPIADGIKRAVSQNPNEVFLIEGHTDAVGNDEDNLSLSDRRAESVAVILTDEFQIPPENLTTQGYGEQQLKVPSDGPERANRRVTVRRITPLLQQGQLDAGAPPPQ
ncbi:OmpA family protein [Pseudorhodoplanes sinuspersici]|uniref:OmpA family protein n=1 Tax=Pseudorhodoplanes sinuspersici TaxID=1235591 RepID=UPI001FD8DD7C|nr:OmpA family protein [Pseudorhodoplanes sinuspersici]